MKCLKKVSLAQKNVADDVKVVLLNDQVKKQLFQKNVGNDNATPAKKPLLHRLWPGIEHYPKSKRQEAIRMIKKLEALPTFQINDNLEMVYNGDVARGTNILQLIRCELFPAVADERVLLPGQDLFYYALSTSPARRSERDIVTPAPSSSAKQKPRSSSTVKKNRERIRTSLLHSSAKKVLFSPKQLRSSARNAPKIQTFKEARYKQ